MNDDFGGKVRKRLSLRTSKVVKLISALLMLRLVLHNCLCTENQSKVLGLKFASYIFIDFKIRTWMVYICICINLLTLYINMILLLNIHDFQNVNGRH
jgi:hypothetical protein